MSINSLVSPPGSHYSPPHHHSTTADPASVADSSEADGNADTMTCDQAWKTLKVSASSMIDRIVLISLAGTSKFAVRLAVIIGRRGLRQNSVYGTCNRFDDPWSRLIAGITSGSSNSD